MKINASIAIAVAFTLMLVTGGTVVQVAMAQSNSTSGRNVTSSAPPPSSRGNDSGRSFKTFGPGSQPTPLFNKNQLSSKAPDTSHGPQASTKPEHAGGGDKGIPPGNPQGFVNRPFIDEPFVPAFGHKSGGSGRSVTSHPISSHPFAGRSFNQGGGVLTTLPSHPQSVLPYHPLSSTLLHSSIPYSSSRNINPYGR